MGLLSIRILSTKTSKSKGKLTIIDEIACLKNKKPYLTTLKWTLSPRIGFTYNLEKSEELSEDEYKNLLKK